MQQFAMQTQFPLQDVSFFCCECQQQREKEIDDSAGFVLYQSIVSTNCGQSERKGEKTSFSLFLVMHSAEDNENHSWERMYWVPAVIFLARLWHSGKFHMVFSCVGMLCSL